MAKVKVTVTGANPVDGHLPGASFTVDDDDPRLRLWERGGNVTRDSPKPKARKKGGK